MREIDADYAKLYLYDDQVVLVVTKAGAVVEGAMVRRAMDLIEAQLNGAYSVVIDRKNEYKLMRFEIYEEVNARQQLIGLAIVTHSRAADMLTDLEVPLCKKKMAKFANVDEAIAWAKRLHDEQGRD